MWVSTGPGPHTYIYPVCDIDKLKYASQYMLTYVKITLTEIKIYIYPNIVCLNLKSHDTKKVSLTSH